MLRGDPSDGLPGVPGIGEKTAATLIRRSAAWTALKHALDAGHGGFPAGTRKKLEAARDYLDVAPAGRANGDRRAAARRSTAPSPRRPPDPDLLTEIGAALGLGSSLTRFRAAVTAQ